MTTQVERDYEVSLDGVRYKLTGQMQSLTASLREGLFAEYRLPSSISSACAASLCVSFVVKILANKRVSIDAMSSRCCTHLNQPSVQVFLSSDWLKMLRVHTGTIATQMVKVKPFGNWAICKFPCCPVGNTASPITSEVPVSERPDMRRPEPARDSIKEWPVFVNLSPKTIFQGGTNLWRAASQWVSVPYKSVIVTGTIPSTLGWLEAIVDMARLFHVANDTGNG